MELRSAQTLARRASKAFDHAARAYAEAETDAARRRHARRMRNAQRLASDARWTMESLACEMYA